LKLFSNKANVVCILEKEIIAVASIADRLKEYMRLSGAYELNKIQADELIKIILARPGSPGHEGAPDKKFVGKSASFIAKQIGLNVPESTKILLMEVEKDHPLVWTEQLMPVIPLVRVNDVNEAIQFAKQVEFGYRHTAIMHSKNIENLSNMAKVMNCSLFVKNGPSYAGLGFGGPGFTTLTIASPTGEGMTKASTFTRERRCTLVGYFRII
jgi:acyl-CoA reductase-like NAD-dependent aldehyde dehydrogenase